MGFDLRTDHCQRPYTHDVSARCFDDSDEWNELDELDELDAQDAYDSIYSPVVDSISVAPRTRWNRSSRVSGGSGPVLRAPKFSTT